MTAHRIQCLHESDDIITVTTSEGSNIAFYPATADSVYVSPADARTFARGIMALADEVDGGEAKAEDTTPQMPAVGDRVRVLKDDANGADVKRGDILTVMAVDSHEVQTKGAGHGGRWYIDHGNVEVVTDETVSPMATALSVATLIPAREACLHRAAELLGVNPYSAHDLMRLADYLAGEGA